ncbi:MAG: hypothetical protein AAF532_12995 [Planctomycetota bacterium]
MGRDIFDVMAIVCGTVAFLSFLTGRLWLAVLIFRGSVQAGCLCLIIPFLELFFVREHWRLARWPLLLMFSAIPLAFAAFAFDAGFGSGVKIDIHPMNR